MNKTIRKILFAACLFLSVVIFVGCDKTTDPDNYEWKTPQTDSLKLKAAYEGKEFIKDGIGEVTPIRYVDGDTTMVKTANGQQVTIRYNGVNTPESTYRIDPWGFAASKYNKSAFAEALAAGAKIVLETENMDNRVDSTGVRYLAWVWFVYPNGDSRLLNLELAELGYAQVKSAAGTRYESYFTKAVSEITNLRLRIYGELDPDYDYSNDAKSMTIREIREQFGTAEAIDDSREAFTPPLIKVSGVIVRKNGYHAYLQQYDEETNQYYGIYVYAGYTDYVELALGALVEITAKPGYYYGSLQITDLTASKIKVHSFNAKDRIEVTDETCDSINDIYAYDKIGTLVKVGGLTVTGFNDSDATSATTLYCQYTDKDGKTQRLNVRIDQNTALYDPETGQQILTGEYFVGKTFESIIGIVAYYNGAQSAPDNDYANGHIQLALTSMDDVVFAE